MEQPYKPFEPLERISQEKGISPEALLKYLILSLQDLGIVNAALSFHKADSTANAFEMVMNTMKFSGKGDRVPKSVFEIVDAFVLAQLTVDRLNAPNNETVAMNAKVGEALHLILQDYQNQIESLGLQSRINLEKRGSVSTRAADA